MLKNIDFGVSTWLWQSPFSTESISLFPKIKALGFDLVEIPVEDPDKIDSSEIKKALSDNGLKVSVCGAFGPSRDLTSDDAALHDNCFKYIEECFKICNALEIGFLAGPMYSAVGKARMLTDDQRKIEWDRAVTNLKKVCKMASDYGQEIALEPLNRFESDLVNNASDVLKLVNDINHPSAKILLDGFHMTIEEKNIKAAIHTVKDKLIHVQVSENHRGVPGTGLTPWKEFGEGLSEIGYEGSIVIESFTPEVKELAGAVCLWKKYEGGQDEFASKGLEFLKETFK